MPNPKSGTVTFDVAKAVNELKAEQDRVPRRQGRERACSGRWASFDEGKLLENARTFLRELMRSEAGGVQGHYVKSLTISSTMGRHHPRPDGHHGRPGPLGGTMPTPQKSSRTEGHLERIAGVRGLYLADFSGPTVER